MIRDRTLNYLLRISYLSKKLLIGEYLQALDRKHVYCPVRCPKHITATDVTLLLAAILSPEER